MTYTFYKNYMRYLHGWKNEVRSEILSPSLLSWHHHVEEAAPTRHLRHGLVAGESHPAVMVGPHVVNCQENTTVTTAFQIPLKQKVIRSHPAVRMYLCVSPKVDATPNVGEVEPSRSKPTYMLLSRFAVRHCRLGSR